VPDLIERPEALAQPDIGGPSTRLDLALGRTHHGKRGSALHMDPSPHPSGPHDPAIRAILDRASRLTGDEVAALARSYDAARQDPSGPDRQRIIAIARSRASRAQELRELERAVAVALHDVAPGVGRRALLRLGILDAAERAILDAVMAEALRDRLGVEVADALRRPWADVA
jgi:hypothetical protein